MNEVKVTNIARPEPKGSIRPLQIVPTKSHIARGLLQVSDVSAAPALNDHGGPILTAVEVVAIYWGAAWAEGNDQQLTIGLDAFFDSILTSSLIDLLGEYGRPAEPIGHGRRVASVRITNSEPGSLVSGVRQVTDAEVQAALQGWIAAGTVKATTPNTLYFIYLPVGVKSLMGSGGSCTDYCGYHDHMGGTIFYAVIPYANCDGCEFSGSFLDTLTEVSSHELCEAITDPALNGWWDASNGEEIGDLCNRQTTRLNGYLVQTEWSNRQTACAIAP